MFRARTVSLWGTLGLAIGTAACQKANEQTQALTAPPTAAGAAARAPVDKAPVGRAEVHLGAVGGSGVGGHITMTALADGAGVKVEGQMTGLKPGAHGFHVHEVGNCDSPDGLAAGGHFNPTSAPHGHADAADSHVGDLGNVIADAKGVAVVSVIKAAARLDGPATLVGRSVIVHGDPDDFASQPAGKAGARLGCGIIRAL